MEQSHHSLVAPTGHLSQSWDIHSSLRIDSFLSWAQDFNYKKVIFYEIALNSPLFFEINKKVKASGLTPVYVITSSQFVNSSKIIDWIHEGVEFTLVFNCSLPPEVIAKVQAMGALADKLKFVLLARKDWNLRNAYRSFPYQFRDRLYVDFPSSLYPGDPFHSVDEIKDLQNELEGDFSGEKIKSYCPELARYSRTSAWNVAEISAPPLLESHQPKISIVVTSQADFDWIAQSRIIQERAPELELIVTQVGNESNQPLTQIHSLHTKQIWVQPFQAKRPISRALLYNMATQSAQGKFIIFVNKSSLRLLEPILEEVLEDRSDELRFLRDHQVNLFKTRIFKSIGGFDWLLSTDLAQWFDVAFRYLSFEANNPKNENFASDFFKMDPTNDLEKADRQTLYLKNIKFSDWPGFKRDYSWDNPESTFLSREKKRHLYYRFLDIWINYKSLYKSSFQVALEGNLRFVFLPFILLSSFVKRYLWIFLPTTYPFFWKMRACMIRARDIIFSQIWRLRPSSYRFYWRIRDSFSRNLWRLSPRNMGWFLFKIAYPLRKIYYFASYQFEKRVLGLHKRMDRKDKRGLR